MAKHNKKRNVGLIHEQLVRYASEKIVDDERNIAENAINILNKHFSEGTELYKEFLLFNALVHTQVQSENIARRIIDESKDACKNHDANKLRSEKSLLIRSINHELNERKFYGNKISEYRIFATVQALLNEWRGAGRLAPNEIVKYETVLEEWLSRESQTTGMDKNPEADPLALEIMIKKFNKKYSSCLNRDQTRLLEFKLLADDDGVKNQIKIIKQKARKILENFYAKCDNDVLNNKHALIENKIRAMKISTHDSSVKKALMISALTEEMEDDNE